MERKDVNNGAEHIRSASFMIPGRLPGLNEYSNAERTNPKKAATMKRDAEHRIILAAKAQLRGIRFRSKVIMRYLWIEPNRRRDKDNIAFAKKFVQDALVKAGVLQNDGWDYVDGFSDKFAVDRKDPCVLVYIQEIRAQGRT